MQRCACENTCRLSKYLCFSFPLHFCWIISPESSSDCFVHVSPSSCRRQAGPGRRRLPLLQSNERRPGDADHRRRGAHLADGHPHPRRQVGRRSVSIGMISFKQIFFYFVIAFHFSLLLLRLWIFPSLPWYLRAFILLLFSILIYIFSCSYFQPIFLNLE